MRLSKRDLYYLFYTKKSKYCNFPSICLPIWGIGPIFKYNLETYIHERWFPMMPSGKFAQSSGRHLFPIFF